MNALARSAWVQDEIRQIGERIKKGQISANVFAGGNDFHSVREWISVQDMAISAATVVELLRLLAEPH